MKSKFKIGELVVFSDLFIDILGWNGGLWGWSIFRLIDQPLTIKHVNDDGLMSTASYTINEDNGVFRYYEKWLESYEGSSFELGEELFEI